MAWWWQLDNDGVKTDYRRFFNENEERAMELFASKKRNKLKWIRCEAKELAVMPEEITKPTKSVTFIDVENATTVEELNELYKSAGARTKSAIKKKLVVLMEQKESLTNKNEEPNE